MLVSTSAAAPFDRMSEIRVHPADSEEAEKRETGEREKVMKPGDKKGCCIALFPQVQKMIGSTQGTDHTGKVVGMFMKVRRGRGQGVVRVRPMMTGGRLCIDL